VGCEKDLLPPRRASEPLLRWHIACDAARGRRCSRSRFADVLMILLEFNISINQNSGLPQLKKLTYQRDNSLASPT
jgi:hypothetical protein